MDTMIAFCVRIVYIRSLLARSPELQSIKKSSIGSSPEGSHGRYDPTIKNALIVEGQVSWKLSRLKIFSSYDGDWVLRIRRCLDVHLLFRVAIIKLETDGSFRLKNLGASSISLTGNQVAHGQVVSLGSSYLIEMVPLDFY
ncbi:SMAD/FHA domain, Microspherule protein domain protein [Artemisia annua]|uniref:SMAD/FHA domain, Microspherule protein domain protein n=1 Tax=Artemisia annua TaxID=35608 RepID=A0A2U1P3T9_ARTAN|nr:SMAD/FHA domain, Microspherule protein domain protein [Artemisia annua]